ncbi:MAG: Glycerol-3-phosphate responsive antiterminator [Firmicutes bacterium ADurb.Bin182]|nr:MAG: Glycerol-3-phosphate responsive antiterminator [Firmicutes bacterium ADurb.Bin182]
MNYLISKNKNGNDLCELFLSNPVAAAVKNDEGLNKSLESDSPVIFVLYGDIIRIPEIVSRIKSSGKIAMVHIDLVDGLSQREIAADFIARKTDADGILSTKQQIIRHAKSLGLLTIQRFFLLDSMTLENIEKQLPQECADMIEILPGPMPKVVKKITAFSSKPVIVGGLISDKEDIINSLKAGAVAVSTTNPELWFV